MTDKVLSTRIPEELLKQVKKAIEAGYMNEADFYRSAIRHELARAKLLKAPKITKQHTEEAKEYTGLTQQQFEDWVNNL